MTVVMSIDHQLNHKVNPLIIRQKPQRNNSISVKKNEWKGGFDFILIQFGCMPECNWLLLSIKTRTVIHDC